MIPKIEVLTCLCLALAACGSPGAGDDPFAIAEEDYPVMLDMHVDVMANTCSPNPGVCHASNNYPDLTTAGNLLALVDAPCNIELPDPLQGWDPCEQAPDSLVVDAFASAIAWTERVTPSEWTLELESAATATEVAFFRIETPDGVPLLNIPEPDPPIEEPPEGEEPEVPLTVTVALETGSKRAVVTVVGDDAVATDGVDYIMQTVIGGDPNQNGIWGGRDESVPRGSMIAAGNLEESYIWGRITGTAPGTRMPLANGPVTNAQYVALGCWIEGLSAGAGNASDPIDYAGCSLKGREIDFEIEDF